MGEDDFEELAGGFFALTDEEPVLCARCGLPIGEDKERRVRPDGKAEHLKCPEVKGGESSGQDQADAS